MSAARREMIEHWQCRTDGADLILRLERAESYVKFDSNISRRHTSCTTYAAVISCYSVFALTTAFTTEQTTVGAVKLSFMVLPRSDHALINKACPVEDSGQTGTAHFSRKEENQQARSTERTSLDTNIV